MTKSILLNKNSKILTTLSFSLVLIITATANAALTGGPAIIPAPASVVNSSVAGGASNTFQEAFDERQNVVLPIPVAVDGGGFIPAGTRVNSHMIFLNVPDGAPGASDLQKAWTFDGPILGVMSDSTGALEVASTPILGAPGTIYPVAPFGARGMEGNDAYIVAGNTITVDMRVSQPGDWIRVVTKWVDTVAPEATCVETVNPHGAKKPQAPGTGQNEDGFYELLARDNHDEDVAIFVSDSETGVVFGPFAPGTKIKYVEANGAEPKMTAMGGNNGKGNGQAVSVDVQIKGQGDALVYAVDASGNISGRTACLVPNPPK